MFAERRLTHVPVMETSEAGEQRLRGLLSAAKIKRLLSRPESVRHDPAGASHPCAATDSAGGCASSPMAAAPAVVAGFRRWSWRRLRPWGPRRLGVTLKSLLAPQSRPFLAYPGLGARLRWAARADVEPTAIKGGDPSGTHKRWFGRVSGRDGWWRGSLLVNASYWPGRHSVMRAGSSPRARPVQWMDAPMQLPCGRPWSVGNSAGGGMAGPCGLRHFCLLSISIFFTTTGEWMFHVPSGIAFAPPASSHSVQTIASSLDIAVLVHERHLATPVRAVVAHREDR